MTWLRGFAATLAALIFVVPAVHAVDAPASPVVAQGTVQPAFAPWDDVEGLIAQAIGSAQSQILIQTYLLTSREIAATLVMAKRRGVDVRILADAEQHARTVTSKLPELADAGIAIWLETKYQNAHNKILVIDADTANATVVTGSFNLTWTAQHKNAENILILRKNPLLAARYAANWERHCLGAIPYTQTGSK
jgi:phosphatidylserine/phosphatidylglycerophosphate/cardiolipin synthase-like enzyme